MGRTLECWISSLVFGDKLFIQIPATFAPEDLWESPPPNNPSQVKLQLTKTNSKSFTNQSLSIMVAIFISIKKSMLKKMYIYSQKFQLLISRSGYHGDDSISLHLGSVFFNLFNVTAA